MEERWATILVFFSTLHSVTSYCIPYNSTGGQLDCWPSKDKWKALGDSLTGRLSLLTSTEDSYKICEYQGDNAFKISKTGHGMCMQYHDCSKAFCHKYKRWNIPAYSVEARNVKDIQTAIAFANEHNIAVTIKTSGHSYSGSSMGYGTLLIWMYNFKKYGNIKSSFQNACGTTHSNVLHIGGGQTWKEAYDVVGNKFHIVGGGGLTVSAAGGWLMGGGLSAMSRNHGMGIDNVLRFDVVLANGNHVTADKCSHPDLFWALRGGGGGSFGVVTSVHYQLHPVQPIVFAYFEVTDIYTWPHPSNTTHAWIDIWVEKSPHLDKRWGGYWTLTSYLLYFLGSMEDAKSTFLNDFYAWKNSLPPAAQLSIKTSATSYNSYYESRGGPFATTDKTGHKEFNIASRLIPRDWVLNSGEAKKTLKWMVANGFHTFNYLLGGVMMDIGADETSVHPAMRKAIWQINDLLGDKIIRKLREVVKDTGAGYNHANKREPDWQNAFWDQNLNRLNSIKKQYDPEYRFNCWHCVGYKEMPMAPPSSRSEVILPSLLFTFFSVVIVYFTQ